MIECDLKDDDMPARFVDVRDYSTEKRYLLRVDPRDQRTKTPFGALSTTAPFPVTEEEYRAMEMET